MQILFLYFKVYNFSRFSNANDLDEIAIQILFINFIEQIQIKKKQFIE
jgi:hypothetical protein